VLVVEDNDVNQQVVIGMLKRMGVDYRAVNNGREAVTEFTRTKQHYDGVLMDCEMPDMDGYQATEAIRSWEAEHQLAPTPIIALTAHVLQEHKSRLAEVGMDGHLAKPVSMELLAQMLRQVFKLNNSAA